MALPQRLSASLKKRLVRTKRFLVYTFLFHIVTFFIKGKFFLKIHGQIFRLMFYIFCL